MEKLFYHKHQFVPSDRTLELYFSGCSKRCPGCHNSFLHERNEENTRELDVDEIVKELTDYVNISRSVHILGGEPMEQDREAMSLLLKTLRELGFKDVYFFTGWDVTASLIESEWNLFKYCDYIKTGWYDESQLTEGREKSSQDGKLSLASRNQYIIELNRNRGND